MMRLRLWLRQFFSPGRILAEDAPHEIRGGDLETAHVGRGQGEHEATTRVGEGQQLQRAVTAVGSEPRRPVEGDGGGGGGQAMQLLQERAGRGRCAQVAGYGVAS